MRLFGRLLLASVGTIGFAAAASAQGMNLNLTGVVEAWGGYHILQTTQNASPPDGQQFAWGANAAINIPIGQFSIQPEVRYERYNNAIQFAPTGALVFGGHASVRDNGQFLFGLFAASAHAYGNELNADTPAYRQLGYLWGAEMQLAGPRAMLYLQAGAGNVPTDFDAGPEGFVNGFFARAIGRFLVSDNFVLEAEYTYAYTNCFIDGACAPAEDAGIGNAWGVRAILGLGQSPAFLTVAYENIRIFATEDPDTGREQIIKVGIGFLLGGGTVGGEMRAGAGLTLPMLPVRMGANAEGLD